MADAQAAIDRLCALRPAAISMSSEEIKIKTEAEKACRAAATTAAAAMSDDGDDQDIRDLAYEAYTEVYRTHGYETSVEVSSAARWTANEDANYAINRETAKRMGL
jgi:hypothetical protein